MKTKKDCAQCFIEKKFKGVTFIFDDDCMNRDCCQKTKNIIFGEFLGNGVSGTVNLIDNDVDKKYVIKTGTRGDNNKRWYTEVTTLLFLNKAMDDNKNILVPRLYDAWKCGKQDFIVTQKLTGPNLDSIFHSWKEKKSDLPFNNESIENLAKNLIAINSTGIEHGDTYLGNIVWNQTDKRFYFIDFEKSEKIMERRYTVDEFDKVNQHRFDIDFKPLLNSLAKYSENVSKVFEDSYYHNLPLNEKLYNSTTLKQLLKEKNINVNIVDKYCQTPLMHFSYNGDAECVKMLIKKGARVNMQDELGRTALMLAALNGKFNVMRILIDSGSETKLKAKNGKTVYWFCQSSLECKELLKYD